MLLNLAGWDLRATQRMRYKMASHRVLSLILLLTHHTIFYCASAAVHHSLDTNERDSDGAYKARDSDHYSGLQHNVDFDHEAILGTYIFVPYLPFCLGLFDGDVSSGLVLMRCSSQFTAGGSRSVWQCL